MTNSNRAMRRGTAALMGLLIAAPAARAQAVLDVRVTDARTHEPLPRARAVLLDGRGGLTDDAGVLRLTALGPGTWVVEVSQLGYRPRRALARLPAAGAGSLVRLEVALEEVPIELAEVRVRAGTASRNRLIAAFYARARNGAGQYFTRDEIERVNPRAVSDLFRMVPGMLLVSTATGDRAQMDGGSGGAAGVRERGVSGLLGGGSRAGAGACPILYYLDGTPIEAANGVISTEVDVREVEGIEIYRRITTAPPQFRRGGEVCGIVLIWKREKITGRRLPADTLS